MARSIYMITYSQADLSIFPNKQSFADAIVSQISETKTNVKQWVCCNEDHAVSGLHYHLAIKLDRVKRWLPIRNMIHQIYGVNVNFTESHDNYYGAWLYVTKQDENYIQSVGHPDLTTNNAPRTSNATRAKRNNKSSTQSTKTTGRKAKIRKLNNLSVSDVILKNEIKTKTHLYALAQKQKDEGKTDLAEFILNKGPKKITELIQNTWDMQNAATEIERQNKTRMEILTNTLTEDCVPGCNGDWLLCALQTLTLNKIVVDDFKAAVVELISNGRGKYRNIMLVGPANCGKTFLLRPLCQIYQCFVSPASTTFAWVGAEEAEVLFLNDFRWSEKIIPWHDLLQLLEGEPIHLPAPKTHYAKDLILEKDTPIFCTSNSRIRKYSRGVLDEIESEMMDVRWRVFKLKHQIEQSEVKELRPCCRCFANLILDY